MGKKADLRGRVFGRLTVVSEAPRTGKSSVRWFVLCECGVSTDVLGASLVSGATQSCGCLHREGLVARSTTHGLAKAGKRRSSTYNCWSHVVDRCTNPRNKNWAYYGGRGISLDPRWRTFENFLVDMGERPAGLEIDRKDNEGPYNKENCHWTTRKINIRNCRSNRLIHYQGRDMTIAEAAELSGLNYSTLYTRITKGTGTDLFRPVER